MPIQFPDREEMIEYIVSNPDSGLTIYSREELDQMGTSQIYSIWLRR